MINKKRKAEILIVEDESLVALEIEETLEMQGYKVMNTASSGEETLEILLENRPDLILMDIRLDGEMDGIETASEIRDLYRIPVIFLTAHSDEKTLARAKTTGSYGYLLKPFDDRAMKATIEMALYKSSEEVELRENSALMSIIFRSLSEGVIVTNIKGDVQFANEYTMESTGWKKDNLHGNNIARFLHVYDSPEKHELLAISSAIIKGKLLQYKQVWLFLDEENGIPITLTIAPLKSQNQVTIGGLILFRREDLKDSEKEVQRQLEEPVKFQKSLLPKPGVLCQSLNIDWLFYPSTYGSGDLFNVFPLDKEHIGFYQFDVTGQGFSAAIFSMTLYNLLSPKASKSGILKDSDGTINSPGTVLNELNKRFFFDEDDNPFFTIVYGIYNCTTQSVILAKGGHLPPVLQKGDKLFPLKMEGKAVGLFKETCFQQQEFVMEPGDRLYIYSDGLMESSNRYSNDFSNEKLIQFLRSKNGISINQLIEHLKLTISDWRDNRQFDDDAAFLVIESLEK